MQLSNQANSPGLALIPPSPISHQVPVELRAGISNSSPERKTYTVSFFLDRADEKQCLHTVKITVEPGTTATIKHLWQSEARHAGKHTIILQVQYDTTRSEVTRPLHIIESSHRSLDIIAGAFSGFMHWSDKEGRLWNDELKTFTEDEWRKLVHAQFELGMNIMVPQEVFRNQDYVGEHNIEKDGYFGAACYDSSLYPNRMPIATPDPLSVVLEEADKLGMQVFMPVGMYAWFDFTTGSLNWHKRIATELWQRYGHHESFYGWYVSEEIAGDLGTDDSRREELVTFFQEFSAHCRQLAPEKPVMLATNCHYIKKGLDYYPRLFANLDIICPFGFQRMPEDDISADEAASLLQKLCDEAGAHLWLDMEVFNFHDDTALYPRPIDELIEELYRRHAFEKIICYQFPGMFNAPHATKQPGGPDTVRLFNDYKQFVIDTLPEILPDSSVAPASESETEIAAGAVGK